MLLSVSRSGGLAGLLLVWEVDVDRQPDRDAWVGLIADIPWQDARPAPIEPDRYVYRIHCPPHDATVPERQLTGPWRDLVDRVRDTTEPRRASPTGER